MGFFCAAKTPEMRSCYEKKSATDVVALVQMGMLAAIAVVLVMLIHFPHHPAVSFIEYDMADVPVLIGTLLYGPIPGLLILLVASLVQAFILGINGWVGFVMHFVASGAMVLLVGILYDRKPSLTGMTVGMALGSLARTLVMIPLNLILTVHAFGVPHDVVMSLMLPGIIPMNLIIAVTNCILAACCLRPSPPSCRKIATLHRESNACPFAFWASSGKIPPGLVLFREAC